MSEASTSQREILTRFLASSDARCPSCRYALRGCASNRCPECGCELHLQIASPRLISAWWMAGLLGLCASATVVFLILIGLGQLVVNELRNPGLRVQVRSGFASASELPRWTPIILLTIVLLLLTLALAWFATRRAAFTRLHYPRCAWIGLLAAASPLIVIGIIALALVRL